MPRRLVFRAKSPLGYRVTLTRDRWREIVRFKHPAIKDYQSQLEVCITQPDIVRASSKDDTVHLHYMHLTDNRHICVVAAPTGQDDYFVVTAYLTQRIKPGNELWKK